MGEATLNAQEKARQRQGFSPSSPNLSVHAAAQYISTVSPSPSFWQLVLFVRLSQHSNKKHRKKPSLLFPIFKL